MTKKIATRSKLDGVTKEIRPTDTFVCWNWLKLSECSNISTTIH